MSKPDSRIFAWFTYDFATDKSATTYDPAVAGRWIAKGWPVTTLVLESLLAEAERERDAFKQHCDLLTHKVITCGVAAQNPDATLTTRGAYATKWDSPQAQHVRKLRAERDALQSRLDAVVRLADEWLAAVRKNGVYDEFDSGLNAARTSDANELRAALGGECRGDGEERK